MRRHGMRQQGIVRGAAIATGLGLIAGPAAALAQPAPETKPETAAPANPVSGAAAPGTTINPREQQLLERIRQLKAPRWRSYGVCRYDWSAWRLTEGAVRTTDVECGANNSRAVVAVHCDTLQVSRREGDTAWSPWRLPLTAAESKTTGGEDLMVAALCANITPTSEGATGAPAPLKTVPNPASPAAKPAASTKPSNAKPTTAKPTTAKPAGQSPGNR